MILVTGIQHSNWTFTCLVTTDLLEVIMWVEGRKTKWGLWLHDRLSAAHQVKVRGSGKDFRSKAFI